MKMKNNKIENLNKPMKRKEKRPKRVFAKILNLRACDAERKYRCEANKKEK
jgi:hypothetical protein